MVFAILDSLAFLMASSDSFELGLIFSGMLLVVGLPICLEQVVKDQRMLAGDTGQKTAPGV